MPAESGGGDPRSRTGAREEIARRRAEQIVGFLGQAETAWAGGDFDATVAACEEVLIRDPEHGRALDLLDAVKAELDAREAERIRQDEERRRAEAERARQEAERARQEAERRAAEEARQHALEREIHDIHADLDAGRLSEASDRIATLEAQGVVPAAIRALQSRAEALREAVEAREAAAAEHVARAAGLFARRDEAGAAARLDAALALVPDYPGALALRARIEREAALHGAPARSHAPLTRPTPVRAPVARDLAGEGSSRDALDEFSSEADLARPAVRQTPRPPAIPAVPPTAPARPRPADEPSPAVALPPSLARGSEPPGPEPSGRRPLPLSGPIVAVAAAVLFSGAMWAAFRRAPSAPQPASAASPAVAAPVGGFAPAPGNPPASADVPSVVPPPEPPSPTADIPPGNAVVAAAENRKPAATDVPVSPPVRQAAPTRPAPAPPVAPIRTEPPATPAPGAPVPTSQPPGAIVRDEPRVAATAPPAAPPVRPAAAPVEPPAPAVAVREPAAATPRAGDAAELTDVDERGVRETLQAYAAAYSGLDVAGVKRVFPGVNEPALRRAFGALRSQQVDIQGEQLAVAGDTATVSCTLVATAVGQVGSPVPQRDARRVIFNLAKRGGVWVIVDRR